MSRGVQGGDGCSVTGSGRPADTMTSGQVPEGREGDAKGEESEVGRSCCLRGSELEGAGRWSGAARGLNVPAV